MNLSKELALFLNQEAEWRHQTINLNASENYTSPLVKNLVGLHPSYDFYDFPPSGGIILGPWNFSDAIYLEKISKHINKLSKNLLSCPILDTKAKGGQVTEIAILSALAKRNDKVFYIKEEDGGHFGLNFISKKIGVMLIPIYFNNKTYKIDVENTIKKIRKVWKNTTSRKLIILSQSFILREQPLKNLVENIKNDFHNTIITYDISHILGLIIGKKLKNPIQEGVDIIHGSTHKTFPGPQKGIIGFPIFLHKNIIKNIQDALSPGLQSNCGTSEVLALGAALEEMKTFGESYAQTICENSKYLANKLYSLGLKIPGKKFGFTETHQVWIIIGTEEKTWQACSKLHRAGIRVYPTYLPFVKIWGLRLGTNAITRLGFSINDIETIAKWIIDVLVKNIKPENIFKNVQSFMKNFPIKKVSFTFKKTNKK
ncbi:MAG: hypothetical protein RA162_00050 (plasmid) [Arsenophonus sp.]|nr:MAG: hypothetical protein RA162_00050 [Arsenophonus sp.]